MLEILMDAFVDALVDCLKMLPILYIAYLVMELFEHHAGEKTNRIIMRVGKAGPAVGGLLGIIPQCGFSGAVAGFYAARIVSLGTLMAVFLSTSDEMLPILISGNVSAGTIGKVLLYKVVGGIILGFAVDLVFRFRKKETAEPDIHDMCTREHCSCDHKNVFLSALIHSARVILMIFIVSLALNLVFEFGGKDVLSDFILNRPLLGEVTAGLIGLVPNCSASVLITNLYVDGVISIGAMMSGLMVNGGVGLLVLYRLNKNIKENIAITVLLYVLGVIGGIAIGLLW